MIYTSFSEKKPKLSEETKWTSLVTISHDNWGYQTRASA